MIQMCGEWIYIINKVPIVEEKYVLEADPHKVRDIQADTKLIELKTQINRLNDNSVDCH